MFGVSAQQLGRVETEPCLDTLLLNAQGNGFQQFSRARVQLQGFLVHKERHRHAPVALARYAPVGAVLDHRFEARTSP